MSEIRVDTITNSAGTGAPSFTYGISGTAPTRQKFLSGSGTYTTPANVKWLRVRLVGGGGGGAGSQGTTSIGAGSNGTATTFGSSLLTANPGNGATSGVTYSAGGIGGTATVTESATVLQLVAVKGGDGGPGIYSIGNELGGAGGSSVFGGNGRGSIGTLNTDTDGSANTGAGGGGSSDGASGTSSSGGGGGAGGYCEAMIISPSASYAYSVGTGGAGGSGGTGGSAGSAGGSGVIIVEEYYA